MTGHNAVEALLTAIVIGAIGIPSATRVALSVVMLTNKTAPWRRAVGLLIGSTAVFGAFALVGLFGVQGPGVSGATPTVNTVLGSAMIVAAVAMVVVRRWRMHDPVPRQSQHPGLAAAGVGAGVAFQSFGRLLVLLAGGYRIGTLSSVPGVGLTAVAVMIAVWQTPVWGPMALYVFSRRRFDALERRVRPALDRVENGILGAVIVGAVGVWLLLLGLTG